MLSITHGKLKNMANIPNLVLQFSFSLVGHICTLIPPESIGHSYSSVVPPRSRDHIVFIWHDCIATFAEPL